MVKNLSLYIYIAMIIIIFDNKMFDDIILIQLA